MRLRSAGSELEQPESGKRDGDAGTTADGEQHGGLVGVLAGHQQMDRRCGESGKGEVVDTPRHQCGGIRRRASEVSSITSTTSPP